MLVMEESLAMRDSSVIIFGLGVLLPERSRKCTMIGERGKGARTALCFVMDPDMLPPNEISYIMEVFEA